jgi:hypothetical protein
VYRFTLNSLAAIARIFFGGAKYDPQRELGPYQLWARAAGECGVENVVSRRVSLLAPPRIEGARPPLTVSIWPNGSAGSASARIFVRGVARGIELRHESLWTGASRLMGGSELALGDPYFDDRFFVGGEPLVVRACFDAATRALAHQLFGPPPSVAREVLGADDQSIGIADGVVEARFLDRGYPHPPLTPAELLGRALAFAERLSPDDLEARLAAVALDDPLTDVRLGALQALQAERPDHPATAAALEAGRGDVDPRVRLEAASMLGVVKGGRDTLLALASDETIADRVSAQAVTELRSHLPVAQARTILAAALRVRRLETAAACVDRLGRSGEDAALIARVLEREAGALATAAARALGRCGTADDVPLLREVEARHPRTDPLAVACRGAVASIHTRQPGASQGRLSLSADHSGQVSLTGDEAGRVSLDPGETRRRTE